MDIGSFITQHWDAFVEMPATFLLFGILVAGLAVAITRAVSAGALEAARERLASAKDEIERLKGEKSSLLEKLDLHGEDISAIKNEVSNLPRIIASDRRPGPDDIGREGDIWIQHEK
jgi:septal ring factor EnvC (AmiA/AmiB activator)